MRIISKSQIYNKIKRPSLYTRKGPGRAPDSWEGKPGQIDLSYMELDT